MADTAEIVLEIKDLDISFRSAGETIHAIRGVNLILRRGETVALVGESGSGKSTIGKCIIGLNRPSGGTIRFKDEVLKPGENLRDIQMIFQDPMASLNPRKKVSDIVGAGLDIHKLCKSPEERSERIGAMLERVGLSRDQGQRYPSQFSGGHCPLYTG